MARGFGTTVWCSDSMQIGRYISGYLALALACYRRLTTPRGALAAGSEIATEAERDYGLDLAGYVGAFGETAVPIAEGLAAAELRKEERVASVTAKGWIEESGNPTELVMRLRLTVQAADPAESFEMTMAISAVEGAELIEVRQT